MGKDPAASQYLRSSHKIYIMGILAKAALWVGSACPDTRVREGERGGPPHMNGVRVSCMIPIGRGYK